MTVPRVDWEWPRCLSDVGLHWICSIRVVLWLVAVSVLGVLYALGVLFDFEDVALVFIGGFLHLNIYFGLISLLLVELVLLSEENQLVRADAIILNNLIALHHYLRIVCHVWLHHFQLVVFGVALF